MPLSEQVMSDQRTLISALHTIASETEDVEDMRLAMSALTNTEAGRTFLSAHPINV